MAKAKKSGNAVKSSAARAPESQKKTVRKNAAGVPMAAPVDIKDEKMNDAPKVRPVGGSALFEEHPPIPNVIKLTVAAWDILRNNWQVFGGVMLIYAAMNIIFIQGLHAESNLPSLQSTLNQVPTSGLGHVADGVSLITTLIGASGTSVAPTAGPYQFILAVVVSLATIWGCREVFAKRNFSIRDLFYKGMYPFIPFLLVGLLILMQLLPFAIGSALYSIVVANGIASGLLLQAVFIVLFLLLMGVSLYLLCSSLFALYIVTLPGMAPWASSRTARDLVAHRRFTIMRKLLFLPLLLFAVCCVVLLPFVLWWAAAAIWAFTLLAAALLVFGHIYMYTLYRALI
jgi:hypothetical protein